MKKLIQRALTKAGCFVTALLLVFTCMFVPDCGIFGTKIENAAAAAAKLNKTKLTLTLDDDTASVFKLKVKNASGKYKWSSSNSKVVKITAKKGKSTTLVGISEGTAVISAVKGSKTLKCTVYVKAKADSGKEQAKSVLKTFEEDIAGDEYGILYSDKREAYVGRKYYEITDEKSLVLAISDGLKKGIRGIVLKYDTNNWQYWQGLYEKNKNCSEFGSCVRDSVWVDYAEKGELGIYPSYKYADQAICYYRYKEPEIDDDTMKLLKAAYKLAKEAVEAHPDDVKAILLYANDKICEMTKYTNPIPKGLGVPERDATGVFFNGIAVCAGYTSAYKMVLDILGIENDILVNDQKPDANAYHCWNHVKVDGKWYHIDVTWNDAEGSMKNRMFMLTDKELEKECESRGDTSAHKWGAKFLKY